MTATIDRRHFLKASLGADLHIWGPEFGGTARIKVFLFSFTIKFGDQGSQLPQAIPWSDFRGSFLPADDEVCSVAVAEGLTRQVKTKVGDEDRWVVAPVHSTPLDRCSYRTTVTYRS